MELIQADQFPRLVERRLRIDVIAVQAGRRRQEFGVVEQKLALTVGALVAALRRVGAAMQLQVELAIPRRQPVARFGFQFLVEFLDRTVAHLGQAREVAHCADVFKHLTRGTAAAVAVAKGHQQRLLQFLLLEVLPRPKILRWRRHSVVGAGVGAKVGRGAEVGEHLRAVQPLPPEGVVGQAVVLAPADLDREEVFQPGFLDELRQVPGVAKDVGQPEHRRFGAGAEVLAEEGAAKQELARQRFGPAQVAVRLDPHAADGFPASFGDARLDVLEKLRVVLAHVVVELRLALREVIFRKLLHQPQHSVEGAASLLPRDAQRPQPGHIDVSVTRADHLDVERRPGFGDAGVQRSMGGGHTGVELLAKRGVAGRHEGESFQVLHRRGARVEYLEGGVERVEQMPLRRVVVVEARGCLQRHARRDQKVARRLVDQHNFAWSHEERARARVDGVAKETAPAVQVEQMLGAVAPVRGQANLLVMAVASGVSHAVDVGKRLRMAEVARLTQRQIKGNRGVGGPIVRHTKGGAQHEVGVALAPVAVWLDHCPLRTIDLSADQGRGRLKAGG